MQRIRFLTCHGSWAVLSEELEWKAGDSECEPWLVWEWLVVEALLRSPTIGTELRESGIGSMGKAVRQPAVKSRIRVASRIPATDVCKWFGHSPAVAAKFYAQARPRLRSERRSKQRSRWVTKRGDTKCETGTKAGSVTNHQGCRTEPQAEENHAEIAGTSKDAEGSSDAGEGKTNGR